MPAEGFGTTLLNRPHHLPMTWEHPVPKLCAILWPMAAKNLRQFYHFRSFIIRLIASTAGTSALRVRWV